MEPRIIVRAFIGMLIHHSLNNNLWDPSRRLLNITNEEAAREFTEILLRGIRTNSTPQNEKRKGTVAPKEIAPKKKQKK
jgi:hypothetical protein